MYLLSYSRTSVVFSNNTTATRLRKPLYTLYPGESQFLCCDIWVHGMNGSTHISRSSISLPCSRSTNGLFQSIVPLIGNSAICSVPDKCLSNSPLSSSRPTGVTYEIVPAIWTWAVVDFTVWYPSKTLHMLTSGAPQTIENLRWMCRMWQWSVTLKHPTAM